MHLRCAENLLHHLGRCAFAKIYVLLPQNDKGEDVMEAEFKQLLQIGIIVRSVDKAVRYYEEMLGMGPWEVSYMRGDQPPTDDLRIDGKREPGIVSRLAFLKAYGMEIELIEPIGDSAFKTWLEQHGPGIHHIAAVTNTPYEELLEKYKKETGKAPWIRGQGIGGLMDYSFLDFREETGLIVEGYKNILPDRPRLDY